MRNIPHSVDVNIHCVPGCCNWYWNFQNEKTWFIHRIVRSLTLIYLSTTLKHLVFDLLNPGNVWQLWILLTQDRELIVYVSINTLGVSLYVINPVGVPYSLILYITFSLVSVFIRQFMHARTLTVVIGMFDINAITTCAPSSRYTHIYRLWAWSTVAICKSFVFKSMSHSGIIQSIPPKQKYTGAYKLWTSEGDLKPNDCIM